MVGMIESWAYPKVNLRLLVGPVRADGYHPLRSLMVQLDGPADRVLVSRAEERSVTCAGIDGPANLAWKALDALEAEVGEALPPLAVHIDKVLPSQAGVGGGSSDAAATLRAADQLLGLGLGPQRLERAAAAVGSDVPFFIRGGAQWATGRGEVLEPASAPAFECVIVAPGVGLSTPAVYAAFDSLPDPEPDDNVPPPTDAAGLAAWCRNDLWAPAQSLAPQLIDVFEALGAAGAAPALLCGSGSAFCAITATPASADAIAHRVPIVAPGAQVFRAHFPGTAPSYLE
jgi:4-diphosphocytidyl-2-C-methyl-D-erythritol kinase